MPLICANAHQFDVRCVVFDKDGTLMDFERTWGQRTVQWVEMLIQAVHGDAALGRALYRVLGYDAQRRQAALDGPILAGTAEEIVTLGAGVLYARRHLPWHEAQALAAKAAWATFGAPLADADIQPLGDVQGTIRRLRSAGIQIAVATADNRDITLRCLALLGIAGDVDCLLCGDDPLPQKPDAGVLAWIAGELGLPPAEMLMIGDTVHDMLTGANGGAAGCVAIYPPGQVVPPAITSLATTVIADIGALELCQPPVGTAFA